MTTPLQDDDVEALQRERIRDLQSQALERQVKMLARSSRFYGEKLAGSEVMDHTSLRRLPLTSREEVLAAQADEPPWGGVLAVPMSSVSIIGFSNAITAGLEGGSSLQLAATSGDMRSRVGTASRAFAMGGSGPGDRTAIVGEVARSLLHHQFLGGLVGLGSTPFQTGRGLTLRHARHTLPSMAPTQVVTHPTYALYLARLLEEEGTDLPVERLFLWGEMGPSVPTVRRTLEEAWNHARVRDVYAVEELGVLAAECVEGNGLHCFEDKFVYEVVDPVSGEMKGPGERGELVVTPLHAEAMPLLRYRTGDLVMTEDDRCSCGRTHMRMHVLGRVVEPPSGEPMVIELAKVENLLGRLRSLWGLYRVVLEDHGTFLEVPMAALDEDMQAVAINTTLLAARSTGIDLRPVKELPLFHHRAVRVVRSDQVAWWEALAEEQRRLEQ
jgi:phenylacetate-CoA ligase